MATIEDKENAPAQVKILDMKLDGYDSSADVEYNPLEETNDGSDEDMDLTAASIPEDEVADVLKNLTENEQQDIQKKYPELMEQIKTTQEQKTENIVNVDLNGYDSSADTDYAPLDNTATTMDPESDEDADMTAMSEAEIEDIRNSFPVKSNSDASKPTLRSGSAEPKPSVAELFGAALTGYDSNADDDYAEETAESDDSSADELDESLLPAEEVKSLQAEITESMGVQPETAGSMRIRSGKSIQN